MKPIISRFLMALALLIGTSAAVCHAAAHPPGAAGAAADPHAHGAGPAAELIRAPKEGIITALTTLIVFLVLVVVLGKFAWAPISGGLKAREEKIRKDIQDAEAARARAEQTLAQYNKQVADAEARVRDMLASATADGEKIATNIRLKAQSEAEEIKERATRDIEATRDQALREIYEKTAELATNVAEKIIRRNLNASDQQDLVRQSLEQLQAVK